MFDTQETETFSQKNKVFSYCKLKILFFFLFYGTYKCLSLQKTAFVILVSAAKFLSKVLKAVINSIKSPIAVNHGNTN